MGKKPNRGGNSHQRAKNKSEIYPPPDERANHNDDGAPPTPLASLVSAVDGLSKHWVLTLITLSIGVLFTAAIRRGWLHHLWVWAIIGPPAVWLSYRMQIHAFFGLKKGKFAFYSVLLAICIYGPYLVEGRIQPTSPKQGPIELYAFDSGKGAVVGNHADSALTLESIDVSVETPSGQQSLGWQIDRKIEAHGQANLPFSEHAAKYATPKEYASSHWGEALMAASDTYGRCVALDFVSPQSKKLKAFQTEYEGKPFPLGNATADITYSASNGNDTERLPLSVIIMRKLECPPHN